MILPQLLALRISASGLTHRRRSQRSPRELQRQALTPVWVQKNQSQLRRPSPRRRRRRGSVLQRSSPARTADHVLAMDILSLSGLTGVRRVLDFLGDVIESADLAGVPQMLVLIRVHLLYVTTTSRCKKLVEVQIHAIRDTCSG